MISNQIPTKPTSRKRSPFYWWRRFPIHKSLPTIQPLLSRIQNGDFEYAPYFEQASWEDHWCEEEIQEKKKLFQDTQNFSQEKAEIQMRYAKRRRLLLEDAHKTESNLLHDLFHGLAKLFGGKKEDVEDFAFGFEGTTEDYTGLIANTKVVVGVPATVEEQNILAKLHHKNRPKKKRKTTKEFCSVKLYLYLF
jgi:hypothetical protein